MSDLPKEFGKGELVGHWDLGAGIVVRNDDNALVVLFEDNRLIGFNLEAAFIDLEPIDSRDWGTCPACGESMTRKTSNGGTQPRFGICNNLIRACFLCEALWYERGLDGVRTVVQEVTPSVLVAGELLPRPVGTLGTLHLAATLRATHDETTRATVGEELARRRWRLLAKAIAPLTVIFFVKRAKWMMTMIRGTQWN